MVVREMGRRCNYDINQVERALIKIETILKQHDIDPLTFELEPEDLHKFISIVAIKYSYYTQWEDAHLVRLWRLLIDMIRRRSFPLICIHDAFYAHPSYMNHVRYWYKEILAELAESDILSDLFSQITGQEEIYDKLSDPTAFAKKVRASNYALS